MDEQTYYDISLNGLEAIAKYSEQAAGFSEATAEATAYIANSVGELIDRYDKESKKKTSKKKSNKAFSDVGGTILDIIDQVNKFDDESKTKGDNVIDFFSRFHSDVISKYASSELEGFSNSIDSIINIINKLTTTTFGGYDNEISSIANIINKLTSSVDISNMSPENAEAMKIVIETMSSNILVLGQSLSRSAKWYKTAEPAIPMIGRVISNLVSTVYDNLGGKDDLERAKMAAETIQILSGSVFRLSRSLALSAPLMLLSIPGAAAFSGIMSIMSPVMNRLATQAPMIYEGSKAMRHLSITMVAFSGSMAISALIMKNLEMEDIPKFAGLFGAMGIGALVYSQIGRHSKDIIRGGLGVLAMSASMVIFSKSVEYAVESVPDPAKLGLLALELGGMSLVYGLIGKFSTNILLGSLAVGAMGLSLMVLSRPLETISNVVDENADILWKLPVLLGGLGAVYALAGTPPIPILIAAGAAAFAAVGGSLLLISAGLKKMSEINMTHEDSMNVKYAIEGVVKGFSESFSGMSVKEAVTLPLKITAVASMGGALALLGTGLGKYKQYAGNWDDEDTDGLNYMIKSLSESFALAGSTEGMSKLFGFNVGKNDTQRGIDTTMRMGKNLRRLSEGIKEWKDMDLTQQEMQTIKDNITRVLTTIPNIFAGIGKSDREDSTNQMDFLGMRFSIPFTKTDTELGIKSTMKIGDNLRTLADGITAWKDMPLSDSDLQVIGDNITRVLTTIPNVFASIGKSQREDSANQLSFLGMKFSIPFTKTDTELGIKSTMKMGENLKTLADGVMAWKDGGSSGFSSADLPQIKDNILSILGAIPSAFAEIGKEERETSKGILWWKKGDVERGAKIFDTIGPTLRSVADLVMGFKDIPDVSTHAENMGQGVSTILQHLSTGIGYFDEDKIELLEDLPEPLSELTKIFSDWSDIFKDFANIDFAKVEEAAVLALKLDRIKNGLNYEETEVEVESGITTKSIRTTGTGEEAAPEASKAIVNQSSNDELLNKLLGAIDSLQQSVGMNTMAITDMKEHLVAGTIKTKSVDNEF